MKHPSKSVLHKDISKERKIPFFEQIMRWIDIFTYFDYPNETRAKAIEIAFESVYIKSAKGRPSLIAAACLYIADKKCWENKNYKWKFHKINKILSTKKMKPFHAKLVYSNNRETIIDFDVLEKKGELIEGNKQG